MQVSDDLLISEILLKLNFMDIINLSRVDKHLNSIYNSEILWRKMLKRDFPDAQVKSGGNKGKYIKLVNDFFVGILKRGSVYLETEFPNTDGEIDIFTFPITLIPFGHRPERKLLTIIPDIWIGETGLYSDKLDEENEGMYYIVYKKQGNPGQVVEDDKAEIITPEEAQEIFRTYRNKGYFTFATPTILESDVPELEKFGLISKQ